MTGFMSGTGKINGDSPPRAATGLCAGECVCRKTSPMSCGSLLDRALLLLDCYYCCGCQWSGFPWHRAVEVLWRWPRRRRNGRPSRTIHRSVPCESKTKKEILLKTYMSKKNKMMSRRRMFEGYDNIGTENTVRWFWFSKPWRVVPARARCYFFFFHIFIRS